MTYIKGRYQYPRARFEDVEAMSHTRYLQSKSHKLIVAGMSSRLEAVIDYGEFLGGKSTTIISSSNDDNLRILLAILNSSLATWLTRILFNSLKMAGGYLNFGSREILAIPIPPIPPETRDKICKCVESIENQIKQDIEANIEDEISKLDCLIFDLYKLSEEEIKFIQ